MGLTEPVVVRIRVGVGAAALAIAVSACAGSTNPQADGAANATAAKPTTTTKPTRPAKFTQRRFDFVDTSRDAGKQGDAWFASKRALPTDVYLPDTPGARPLIVLAHGQDGAPDKFTQLLSTWARAGYVVAAPRFPVSSNSGPGMSGLGDYLEQPADMSFVIDQLLKSDIASRIDPHHIGAAGLSLGGGSVYGLVAAPCCRDDRVTAAAIFDGFRFGFPTPYVKNKVPILIVHGDHDPRFNLASALASYRDAASPKWFVTLKNGLHSNAFENTPSPHDAIVKQVTTDYWDATLLDDPGAIGRMEAHASNPQLSSVVGET